MILIAIIFATVAAGVGSVWLAAWLMRSGLEERFGVGAQQLLSLAAGALLATAFIHLLPEAFESGIEPSVLFAVLLAGVLFFFLMDKAELWHHGHEHGLGPEDPVHDHDHAHNDHQHHVHRHDHSGASGGWTVLTGDSVHCFGDGILIASAFAAAPALGAVAALAVLVHEVPHHMGDLVVLRRTSGTRRVALLKVSLAGSVTALGGIVGFLLLDRLHGLLPYFLVVAASSFVYVALADLIPQLQQRLSARQTAVQLAWLLTGLVVVTVVSNLAERGEHHGAAHARAQVRAQQPAVEPVEPAPIVPVSPAR
jgi:zinc and cadmium transporter